MKTDVLAIAVINQIEKDLSDNVLDDLQSLLEFCARDPHMAERMYSYLSVGNRKFYLKHQ